MIRTILFDLDETLYPPHVGIMDRLREHMLVYLQDRLHVSETEADALRRRYFATYGTTLRGLQLRHQIDPEDYMEYVHNIPLGDYLGPNAELDAALDGIPQDKVVFTNASREHAERVLALLGIRRHFLRIVDVRDIEYESKPQPAAYRRVCALLGVHPHECALVEDSVRNLLPAKAAGMTTILVGDGVSAPPSGIDCVIHRIEEIGAAIARLSG